MRTSEGSIVPVLAVVTMLLCSTGSVLDLRAAGGGPDSDGDGVADALDCAPGDSTLWSAPGEVTDASFEAGSPTTLSWTPPADLGGEAGAVTYSVLRSSIAFDFVGRLGCVELGGTDTTASDPRTPPTGRASYYLVRAVSCAPGDPGSTSAGVPRTIGAFAAVDNLNASGPGSLAQTVIDAASGDLVCVPLAGTIQLAGAPITIDKSLTVRGSGDGVLIVDAGASSPAFDLSRPGPDPTEVALADMTIRNGPADQPAVEVAVDTFSLETSSVTDSPYMGIRLGPDMSLEVTRSDLVGNGIGVFLQQGAQLTVESSRIKDSVYGVSLNTKIGSFWSVFVDSSEISGNEVGVFTHAPGFGASSVVITKTLISGNTTGIVSEFYHEALIRNSTITGNGVGIYSGWYGDVTLASSTVGHNVLGVSAYYSGRLDLVNRPVRQCPELLRAERRPRLRVHQW